MMTFYIEDFGAVGDGMTDCAPAITKALSAIAEKKEACEIVFRKGVSYLMREGQGSAIAMDLQSLENLTLKGEETTLILDVTKGLRTYVNINECKNIRMEGFRFKHAKPLYEICKILNIDEENLTMDLESPHDLEIEEYEASVGDYFGLPYTDYNRMHIFFSGLHRLPGEGYRYQLHLKDVDNLHKKLDYTRRRGLDFLLPMPNWAQVECGAFIVTHTENLELENLDMWAYGSFGFHMRYNHGKFLMRNINITPEPGTDMAMTGWRDGVHLKENRCSFLIENCRFEKLHDDIFNLSCTMMVVDQIYSDTEVNLYCREFGGTYWMALKEGDVLTFYDENHGKAYGKNRIKKVIEQKGPINRIVLEKPMHMEEPGVSVGVDTLCQPNTVIRNCYLNGTYRFRTPLLMEDCKMDTMFAWVDTLPFIEGPIPEDITFRNCEFHRLTAPEPSMNFGTEDYIMAIETSAVDGTKPEFACKNIVFDRCKINREELKISHPESVIFV